MPSLRSIDLRLHNKSRGWKSDDDYELLKKRFGNYRWVEKYVPTSPHPLRELYKVEIPELGMTFEYDKLAPKIMWIFLSKPAL